MRRQEEDIALFAHTTVSLTEQIILGTLVVSAILAAALIVGTLVRLRNLKGTPVSGKKKGSLVALAVALAVLIAADAGILQFNNVIGIWFSGFTSETHAMKTAVQGSLALNQTLVDEGLVLLSNPRHTLPLNPAQTKNLNVFGLGSVDSSYSTRLMHRTNEQNPNVVPLRAGLAHAGFTVNPDLVKFYQSKVPQRAAPSIFDLSGDKGVINEVPPQDMPQDLITGAKAFSDVAVVIFGREGGEGGDLRMDMGAKGGDAGKHYLQLQDSEKSLLKLARDTFKTVIVLINSANPMELGILDTLDVDAVLWIGQPGDSGFDAVGRVLAGTTNPSGRLVDTWAYDATSSPAFQNAGDFAYNNSDHPSKSFDGKDITAHESYLDYAEGIYVGYRYYETRWVNNKTGVVDEKAYRAAVQYPFGFGLSYTSFDQKISAFTSDADKLTVEVTVTNTGAVAGKDVVQVYATAPYTVGGIEKSHVVLVGFGKTELLAPGASGKVTVALSSEDLASYDSTHRKAWVLDAGTYQVKLMKNAHEVIDSRDYRVAQTVVFDANHKRSTDLKAATNLFDDVTNGDGIRYVSRADWEGTLPKAQAQAKPATKDQLAALTAPVTAPANLAADIVVADHGLKLIDVVGLAYDDPKWAQYLEQFTVEQMNELIGYGGWNTHPIADQGVPSSESVDGPSGLDNYVNGLGGTGFAAAVVVGSTWNTALAQEFGQKFGVEAKAFGYDGLYGPGMNIHRTPLSGRNFEYYSEDGLLSGKMAAAHVKGLSSEGVFVHIKHFAVNDQETNRQGVCTWLNEQSLRELYLKPFEVAVKEGGATGVMGAFNRIGTKWAGASHALNTDVLRGEWGFHGTVITDFFIGGYFNPDLAVQAGTDLMESTTGAFVSPAATGTTEGRQAMRTATHNILYTIANSNAMQPNPKMGVDNWYWLVIALNLLVLAAVGWGAFRLTRTQNFRRA